LPIEALGRVHAILMPLEAKGDLRLALAAEQNNFVQNLVGILLRIFVLQMRVDQSMALLQDRSRFYLVHEAVFTLEGIAHGASHGLLLSPIFSDCQERV
jgi:hypothetical protein